MAEIGVMKKLTIGGSTYTIPEYSLPIASASTLGGVKIGTGLSINSTTGVLSATGLDFDEADPVFTASAAYGITSNDITNWNSKTSNTGTVTKVTAGTGLSIGSTAGGNFTTSGTINHTNSVTAQTTQAVYPIKIDAQGHISGYGTAVTSMPASDVSSWAKASTKPSYTFSEIGSTPTTISGYGITDAYTKTQVDGLVAGVLHYKGTKASVANLPTTGNTTGDVWHITADGSEYAWDGSIWQELGTAVDLSGYALKSELPTDTNTWRTIQVNDSDILGSGITTGKLNLKAGNAITLSESSGTVTFNHSDTSSQASSSNSGRTYIQSITLDTYGHVTGISTATETVTNTDEKVKVAALTSGTTYYPILATGTGTATRQIDSTLGGLKYISTAGSASAIGTAILQLGNSTASGSSNNEQGILRIYTINTRYVDVKTESTFTPTGSRNRYLPSYDADMYLTGTNTTNAVGGATTAPVYVDNTGCIQAVTSIPYSLLTGTPTIPTVPTNVSAFTNDAGYITSADVPEGASAYTGTISAVTSGNASAGSNNGFARGDHVHNITKTTINTVLGTGSGTTKFYREDGTWATPAYTTNTDKKLEVSEVLNASIYYPIVGTGTTAATRQYDTKGFTYASITGTTSAVGSAQLTLGNSTASGTANNKQGQLIMYGSNTKKATITLAAPSADISLALPTSGGTLALTSQIPTVPTSTGSNTTGITATTTATKTTLGTAGSVTGVQSSTTTASKVTVGSHSTDYGVKSAGSGSFTQGAFTGGSFTQGEDSFTANVPTKIDTSKFNAGSYSHTGFNGGSGSFTQGAFSGGSGSFSASVSNHVLSFSHTHTAATHGADSHTHTAATYGTDSFTAPSLGTGFYTAGTAASFTQGEDEFTPATHGADSHTHTAPTLGSKIPTVSASDVTVPIKNTSATSIPNVSVASATVSITDPGHTHTI